MPPRRNDPCPCGSGRKYKRCCGSVSGAGGSDAPPMGLSEETLEQAREVSTWQAELVGVPVRVSGKERSRMVAAVVVAGEAALSADIQAVTTAEPEEVADMLETAVAEAAAKVGVWPETLVVRHGEVAEFLRPLLHPRGCSVEVAWPLNVLDFFAADLVLHLGGQDTWPAVAPPDTWAAWGLPEATVEALFRAYASFYRAAPWEWFDDIPPIMAEWDDGSEPWVVSVMGAAVGELGLAVYSEPADLETVMARGAGSGEAPSSGDEENAFRLEHDGETSGEPELWPDNPFRKLQGWVVHLGFLPRLELPRAMVKEIARAGWEVEDVAAYPYLMPFLTPGGGLQKELVRRLIALLRGVAAMAEKHGSRLRAPEGGAFTWTEEDLTLHYFSPPLDEPSGTPLPPDLQEVLEEIREGDFETEEDFQVEMGRRMAELNANPLEELGGISPNQAQALMKAGFDEESSLKISDVLDFSELEGADFLVNARTFLSALVETGGTSATAAGNLKRAFVAEMLERMRFEEGYLDTLFQVNKVLNEGDVVPLHVLRVNLEVGGLVKKRKNQFVLTRKGKEMAKPEAAGRLFAHLFRTYFGSFNIYYPGRGADLPGLQPAVPLFLWQLGVRAREWAPVRNLALGLLPPGSEPPPAEGRSGWWAEESDLYHTVLRPLKAFGLLEQRDTGEPHPWRWKPEERHLRTTPLFGRFLRFEW